MRDKTNKKIKTIFMGTPKFAVPILEALIKNSEACGIEIIGVVTEPDKPVGRKQTLTSSPVKIFAQEHNLPVFQPKKIKNWKLEIGNLKPDLGIVAAYGQIIPKEILDVPRYGFLNVHGSLLPELRGPSPIQYAILEGKKETGITIMLIDEKMDEGPILTMSKVKCQMLNVTYEELYEKMARLGAELLIKTLPKYLSGGIKPFPQDHSKATYSKMIKKEDGHINWNKPADYIERQTRAFNPWPGTYAYWKFQISSTKSQINSKSRVLKTKQIKILKARPITKLPNYSIANTPGTIFLTSEKEMAVVCGQNTTLIIDTLQLEGKKPMAAREFLNGYPEIIGSLLQ